MSVVGFGWWSCGKDGACDVRTQEGTIHSVKSGKSPSSAHGISDDALILTFLAFRPVRNGSLCLQVTNSIFCNNSSTNGLRHYWSTKTKEIQSKGYYAKNFLSMLKTVNVVQYRKRQRPLQNVGDKRGALAKQKEFWSWIWPCNRKGSLVENVENPELVWF